MNICEYGCGQEAKYFFSYVKKWCCSNFWNRCPAKKEVLSKAKIGKKNPMYKREVSKETIEKIKQTCLEKYGVDNPRKSKEFQEKSKKTCLKKYGVDHPRKSKTIQEKYRRTCLEKYGVDNPSKTKEFKKFSKELMKNNKYGLLTISKIKKKYPIFYKEEEVRYNPNKPEEKEIQVHCKYNKCPNSKEKGGWFTPKREYISIRIGQLEHPKGNDGSYFYCSDNCKSKCPLYYSRGNDPYKETESSYIPDYEIFRQEVLKRQREEYGYNFCEYCEAEENLHVHHEKPQKTNSLMILDPDNGVVLCEKCHYIVGHKDECSTGNLANISC